MTDQETPSVPPLITYTRFSLTQRIEHIVFLTSFSILGFTGLIQKYAQSPFSQSIMAGLGGIENTRCDSSYGGLCDDGRVDLPRPKPAL